MTSHTRIGIIGAGNMAKAIINGLIKNHFPKHQLWVSEPKQDHLDFLKTTYQVNVTQDNLELANQTDAIILAVKPDVIKTVIASLKSILQQRKPLVISIAAGISTQAIYQWVGDTERKLPIVRAMPNTPAFINQAVTGAFTKNPLSEIHTKITDMILSAIGSYRWLEKEEWLDVVTGLSGSGPAFLFYIIEAMVTQAKHLGLPESIAKEFALKMCMGSASLALSSEEPLSILRQNVTSKGGTTFAGLQKAEALKLNHSIESMIAAAVERAKEISQQCLTT